MNAYFSTLMWGNSQVKDLPYLFKISIAIVRSTWGKQKKIMSNLSNKLTMGWNFFWRSIIISTFFLKSCLWYIHATLIKSVHFKKPVTRSSFLSKSVVIFNITITNMTTHFERNEDRITGFLKWTDFSIKILKRPHHKISEII